MFFFVVFHIIYGFFFWNSDDWMAVPIGVPDCPRGLEYLSTLDKLLVKQKHSLTEAFLGFEANNKYILKNCLGQNVCICPDQISKPC